MKPSLYIPWLILVFLTTGAFLAGINRGSEASIRFVIPLALAGVKIGMVAWYFMELRTVSRLWAVGIGFLTTGILVLAVILQWRTTGTL